jgi:ProP effector
VRPPKAARAGAESAIDPRETACDVSQRLGDLEATSKSGQAHLCNHRQRRKDARRRLALGTRACLDKWFPAAFKPPPFRPLKTGVDIDLLERAPLTKAEARAALSHQCGSLAYLRGLIEGALRIDLDGGPAGFVTAAEAAFAAARLSAIRHRMKQQKAVLPKPKPEADSPKPKQRPVNSLDGAWKRRATPP